MVTSRIWFTATQKVELWLTRKPYAASSFAAQIQQFAMANAEDD